MILHELHTQLLSEALQHILGEPTKGTIAFVRCLTRDVVESLANSSGFVLNNWQVYFVSDHHDQCKRVITADEAVEMRESKTDPTLLVVDTDRAGAGMDGIYSAAQEVFENTLFKEANRLAAREITVKLSRPYREFAEKAVKKAQQRGRRVSVSPWVEFDFYVRIAAEKKYPGDFVYLVGLWPLHKKKDENSATLLNLSDLFVQRLLGNTASNLTIAKRIDSLRLANPTDTQRFMLEKFIHEAGTKSIPQALTELADKPDLWINALQVEQGTQPIQEINLVPWRSKTGTILQWSGLTRAEDEDDPPLFILEPNAEQTGNYSKLEVRWKTKPENLVKNSGEYRVTIYSGMDEELVSQSVWHSGKKEEKCRFTNDDFSFLSEDALVPAKVMVSAMGNNDIEPQESEEFIIRFGNPLGNEKRGIGKKVRTFSEGLIELSDRESVNNCINTNGSHTSEAKDFLILRTREKKSYRVFRPPLIRDVESQWAEKNGEIGRWRIMVRANGDRTGVPEFLPLSTPESFTEKIWESIWERAVNASRRMAEHFHKSGGGVGQIYAEKSKAVENIVKEYVLSWTTLLSEGDPAFALVNTVEVQTLSGRTVGLIVLPSHPLRVSWHAAYDNLVLHTRYEQDSQPKEIREEFAALDGSMFPAFLPGIHRGETFVFADSLGFHAVGMVKDSDKEPKAAVAMLARALGESESADTAPTVGRQSAAVLSQEILKYLECHDVSRLLLIHSLRPGDGSTVARALGIVQKEFQPEVEEEDGENTPKHVPAFVLELYPSPEQRSISGRFISDIREKHRSGAGSLAAEDYWMLESLSLPGGVNLPKLRWARKEKAEPETAAHLAIAFDTFESKTAAVSESQFEHYRPYYAFGLMSFFERHYSNQPSPLWRSFLPSNSEGEKHPSERSHTERLIKIQQSINKCTVRNLSDKDTDMPVLQTEISPEKAQNLKSLHKLCDWVITLDRNAGIEYFDSPRDNQEIYDAYVIDCVPEREDLGCLQLITSTSNQEEIRNLFDRALDQMGLSRSRRNAEFLLEHLKALSGRLAIRLTGQKAPTSELIALALSHAHCVKASENSEEWVSLSNGFFVPIDDVRDLLFPLKVSKSNNEEKESEVRPDLIYVSLGSRKGLWFQFIEVKYRRHLRTARTPELLEQIRDQVESFRKRWESGYADENLNSSFRALRRAKLARVLRFYADKAHRHFLSEADYKDLVCEIDRMIVQGSNYSFSDSPKGQMDRGWIFCPEYTGARPLDVSPDGWSTRIFIFGPALLPDSCIEQQSVPQHDQQPPIRGEGDPVKSNADMIVGTETHSMNDESGPAQENNERQNQDSFIEPPVIHFGKDTLSGADVSWPLTVKGNPHLMIVGLPGMGKTTCLINICRQMLHQGMRPIVFSYHQDIDEKLKNLVGSVRFIDFQGLGFNPLQVYDRTSKYAYLDVAGKLRDIFTAIFPELGDIQGERIRQAIKDSFIERGWDNPDPESNEMIEPEFKRFLEILKDQPKSDHGLRTLLARLNELADYGFFDLGEMRESLWESDEPIIIRIHTTQNDNLQRAFAALVFYGLYKDMFRRGTKERLTHAVIFDEAHRAAQLKLIPTMAKECRKYGISLILASQEAKDFHESLFSTIANYLVLRLTETDAKALARNVASSDQQRLIIDRIKQMERFRAIYFCEGKKRHSLVSLAP